MAAFPSRAANAGLIQIKGIHMDKFQHKLRLLIVTGSTIGFMGGWALLAHAGKPASNTDTVVEDTSTSAAPVAVQVATPAPLPPLDFSAIEAGQGTASIQPLPIAPAIQQQTVPVSRPRFRTRTS
jgi:hypothetical protein